MFDGYILPDFQANGKDFFVHKNIELAVNDLNKMTASKGLEFKFIKDQSNYESAINLIKSESKNTVYAVNIEEPKHSFAAYVDSKNNVHLFDIYNPELNESSINHHLLVNPLQQNSLRNNTCVTYTIATLCKFANEYNRLYKESSASHEDIIDDNFISKMSNRMSTNTVNATISLTLQERKYKFADLIDKNDEYTLKYSPFVSKVISKRDIKSSPYI